MRVRVLAIGLAMLTMAIGFGVTSLPKMASAQGEQQAEQQQGWLEGTVRDENGMPIANIIVDVINKDQKVASFVTEANRGGLYAIRDIRPGTYEVRAWPYYGKYKTVRVFGAVIKPGVRTMLDFKLRPGSDIEEIGQPAVATQPILILSQELARLQKEIDALKAK